MDLNELNTGDLILFSNSDTLFSKIIQYFTKSSYSHIGMVVRDPNFTSKKLEGLFLWESGLETFYDAEDNQIKLGVQISDLSKVIENSNKNQTKLYVRKLINPPNFEKLKDIHDVVHNKPYDLVPKDWIEALERKDDTPQKTDRFWCSALVGYIYTQLGLLSENTDWSILRPSDFSSSYDLNLLMDSSLTKEIKLN